MSARSAAITRLKTSEPPVATSCKVPAIVGDGALLPSVVAAPWVVAVGVVTPPVVVSGLTMGSTDDGVAEGLLVVGVVFTRVGVVRLGLGEITATALGVGLDVWVTDTVGVETVDEEGEGNGLLSTGLGDGLTVIATVRETVTSSMPKPSPNWGALGVESSTDRIRLPVWSSTFCLLPQPS